MGLSKMKYLYLLLTLLLLIALDFYLKANISGINQGALHLPVLALVIFTGGLLALWRGMISGFVYIKHSTLWLMLFLTYFVFRIVIDIGTIEQLKALTIATTGGTVLFYTLGLLVAIAIGQSFVYGMRSKSYAKSLTWLFAFYLTLSFGFLVTVFFELFSRLRSDIFLISDLDGAYQRPGNFLVISLLILTTVYAQILALNQNLYTRTYRFFAPIFFVIYMAYAFLSMVIAQMIGSNNAAVLIAGLSLVLILVCFLVLSRKMKCYMASQHLNIRKILLGVIGRRLVLVLSMSGVFLIAAVMVVASVVGIDLGLTRLGGFGSGEISSVGARLSLLKNFTTQFQYSPVFGNMNVDTLTTGTGSYVHSFLISTLTHLGLIGFFLIVGYFILNYTECFKNMRFDINQLGLLLVNNIFQFYSIMAFSMILLIGIVGTFFTWATIWFAMGLLLVAVRFENKKE